MIDDTIRPVIVAKKTDEAHNMVSFELVDPNGAELPAFSAGSHIDVTIPGGLVRQYSLCNSSSERNRYVIGVCNDGNSRGGSKALHGQVNAGDTLQVGLPRNRFRVPRRLLNTATILQDPPEDTQLFICGADWWQDPIIN